MNWIVITVLSILALGLLGVAGYWAYTKYFHKPVEHEYSVQKDTDRPTNDHWIERLPDKKVDELKKACDALPNCKGFNTNGYLVSELSTAKAHKGIDFYVKGKPKQN